MLGSSQEHCDGKRHLYVLSVTGNVLHIEDSIMSEHKIQENARSLGTFYKLGRSNFIEKRYMPTEIIPVFQLMLQLLQNLSLVEYISLQGRHREVEDR